MNVLRANREALWEALKKVDGKLTEVKIERDEAVALLARIDQEIALLEQGQMLMEV